MSLSQGVRHHVADGAKLIGVWTAWFWSLNWNAVASFLTAVFTLLLILDKLGALAPLKAKVMRLFFRFVPQVTK